MRALALAALLSCTPAASPSGLDLGAYAAEQLACVEHATTRAAADSCRAQSRGRFCTRFPEYNARCQDGGL